MAVANARIAVVTQGYQSAGGVQSVARWLVERLTADGYYVQIFDLASSISDEYSRRILSPRSWTRRSLLSVDSKECDVIHVGANAIELEPMRYLPRRQLSAALKTFDIVQVVAGGAALALSAMTAERPIVLQVATMVAWERSSVLSGSASPASIWRRIMTRVTSGMERNALKQVDSVLVENPHMQRLTQSICEGEVVLAPPGVDTTSFSPSVSGWAHDGYLLSVCRLNDGRKGLDRLVRSYARLLERRPTLPCLVLAGCGSPNRNLTSLIINLGLDGKVDVRPNVPTPDLPDLYRGASIYLQASHEEGLGISVLEAMACGLPVVSTRTAGTSATVLNGSTGWLVGQGSTAEQELVERVIDVLDRNGPRMATEARVRAISKFSTTAAYVPFCEVYTRLLSTTSPASA